jgi:hypothetical protein
MNIINHHVNRKTLVTSYDFRMKGLSHQPQFLCECKYKLEGESTSVKSGWHSTKSGAKEDVANLIVQLEGLSLLPVRDISYTGSFIIDGSVSYDIESSDGRKCNGSANDYKHFVRTLNEFVHR